MVKPEDDYYGVWSEASQPPKRPIVHDTELRLGDLPKVSSYTAERLQRMWEWGDLGTDQVAVEETVSVTFSAARRTIKELENRLDESEAARRRWTEKAGQSHAEWSRQFEEEQRRRAERATAESPRGGKRLNTVKFRVRATFTSDAQPVLDELWQRYGTPQGKAFEVTHGEADGKGLHCLVTYGPVRGGEKSDVRRNLQRCAEAVGVELLDRSRIEVLARVQHVRE